MTDRRFSHITSARLKSTALTMVMLSSLVGGQVLAQPWVDAAQAKTFQSRQNWKSQIHTARLTRSNQLVIQVDVQDKPATSYANAVYMIYAKQSGQWVQIYTNQGARLLTSNAGRTVLAPELVDCNELKQRLGVSDLADVELKTAVLLRYDIPGGGRDQRVQYEQVQRFSQMAQTTQTQLISDRSDQFIQTTSQQGSENQRYENQRYENQRYENRSGFNLTIAQKLRTSRQVTARISLKSRLSQGYQTEQLVGDFKYKLKQNAKAKFIKGVKAGDRIVVRLFSSENQFIGYSEFELLSEQSAVTLVLADRSQDYGVVRTIYGVDRNNDFSIDNNSPVYDYFTQVTQASRYTNSRVTFFKQVQNIDLRAFDISGLPRPQSNCVHPDSFRTGRFTLVNQIFAVFGNNLTQSLIALPGRVIRTTDVSVTSVSTYEISQQIQTGRDVIVVSDRDDDDDKDQKKCKKRQGNQQNGCGYGRGGRFGDNDDDGDDD